MSYIKKIITKKEKLMLISLLIAIIISTYLSIYPITLIKQIVDFSVTRQRKPADLIFVGFWFLTLQVLAAIFLYQANYMQKKLQIFLSAAAQKDLYFNLIQTKLGYIKHKNYIQLSSTLLKDTEYIGENLIEPYTLLIKSILQFGFGFYFLCRIHLALSVLLFPLGMITSVIIQRVKIRSDKNLTEQRKRATQLWEVFTEGILGILSIVLNKNRQIYEDKVKFSIDDLQKVQLQQAKLENVSGFMTRSLFMTTIGIILLFSSILVNRNQISVGELTAVLMYNHMLTDPLLNLLQVNQKISILRASIRRLDEIYHFPKEIIEEKPVSVDEIRLTNISYQFNQKPVFTNISLTIGHAQAIGIFGKTSSGKSTLINLIAGIYEIQEGKLEYLYKSRPVSGKPSVRYMLQDDYVFNDTLAENIRIGNSDLTVQEIETLIDICQLRELYTKSKTEKVGINGSRLSGGERKRLLIARTLASLEYDIYIFDEMSSGLDRNTFLTIYSKIEEILASKIRIYVEHNEETKKILPRWYELKTEKQP